MAEPPRTAAILFEADGYSTSAPHLLGRHVAGSGFLRAAVAARGDGPVIGYGPRAQESEAFALAVKSSDPGAATRWVGPGQLAELAQPGVLYRPDPLLAGDARLRLRVGMANHSLCGVTHTTATARIMNGLAGLLSEPLAPWDAVVCTSQAVAETVRRIHEAEADYLRWRLGAARIEGPQLPVIPLGVACGAFEFTPEERTAARAALGLGPDDVAALYVGRLTFTTKAHPFPALHALQTITERTGRSLALIQCGWVSNPTTEAAFATGAEAFAPDVRVLTVDGREAETLRRSWAAADLFLSLSDNVQETFGLTPVEAMAAGLPCVVSDWNGYRDTVRDGIDGFRVRTWAPAEGVGGMIAAMREGGVLDDEQYCWGAAAATSVDLAQLIERLTALIGSPELRRTMGEAGRARARAVFDWACVFRQYQALWAELEARRMAAKGLAEEAARIAAAPRVRASGLDPFHAFGHYPTGAIGPATVIALASGSTPERYLERVAHRLFLFSHAPRQLALPLLARLEAGPLDMAEGARIMGCDLAAAILAVGTLAKLGVVRLEAPETP